MKSQKMFKKFLLLGVFCLVTGLTVHAQVGEGIGLPNDDPNIVDAPIDGFIGLALASGAALGVRKVLKKK